MLVMGMFCCVVRVGVLFLLVCCVLLFVFWGLVKFFEIVVFVGIGDVFCGDFLDCGLLGVRLVVVVFGWFLVGVVVIGVFWVVGFLVIWVFVVVR